MYPQLCSIAYPFTIITRWHSSYILLHIHDVVLIEIIVFLSLHLNKNTSLMIGNDVFTGTVLALMPLSTQIRFVFVII